MILIIVESPAKCKKIEQYLGSEYKCIASYGHIRELNSLKDIDICNEFHTTYSMIKNNIKERQIVAIHKAIDMADDVILATDDDREGEAISWHLCQVFGLNVATTKRMKFHEITEPALRDAIKNITRIDMNIVKAQQARQIADVLVGFKISPILQHRMTVNRENALSAGRCQTPALRLIYDNYIEIKHNLAHNTYSIVGYFTSLNIPFELSASDYINTEQDVIDFLKKSIGYQHIFTCTSPRLTVKNPPEPFNTSRIQQASSNEFRISPKETMQICQSLYEKGLITYMRTDATSYSKVFLDVIHAYICKHYGNEYVNVNVNDKSGQSASPNSAHEPIRPTDINLTELNDNDTEYTPKERKMYRLIWLNTVKSCMSVSKYNSITANISCVMDGVNYSYTSEQPVFMGWKILDNPGAHQLQVCGDRKRDKENQESKIYTHLQNLTQNQQILYKLIVARNIVKNIKSHYSEATLIQKLEKIGIGRPSTYASIVDKIQDRGYVKKEDVKGVEIKCRNYKLEGSSISLTEENKEFGNEHNKLVIQPLGILVAEYLTEYFTPLFDYGYTSKMETKLDDIANNTDNLVDVCNSINNQIDTLILDVQEKGAGGKYEIKINENDTLIVGKYGPVIKCVDSDNTISFKPVRKDIDINDVINDVSCLTRITDEAAEKREVQRTVGQHNGHDVILKKGRYGIYMVWGENSKTLKEIGNRPLENVTMDELKQYLNDGGNYIIRVIGTNVSIRHGSNGDYIYYKTAKMKKPKFYDIKTFNKDTHCDYKNCNDTIISQWINQKYGI